MTKRFLANRRLGIKFTLISLLAMACDVPGASVMAGKPGCRRLGGTDAVVGLHIFVRSPTAGQRQRDCVIR